MHYFSLAAFTLSGLLAIAFGLRYLRTREFMPYHATVAGRPWNELDGRLQAVILGMLRVCGAGLLGCGIAVLWLLLPLNRGESWAAWAALTGNLATTLPILYVVTWLRRVDPSARTPVVPTIAAIALVVLATLAFFVGR